MITDYQFQQFMNALLADQRTHNHLNLGAWESLFVASYSAAGRKSLWFTAPRRLATGRMWRKYGPELNLPPPPDTGGAPPPAIAPANKDGCEYLVRDEAAGGAQRRCNEPAVSRERRRNGTIGLRYCAAHEQHVRQRCPDILLQEIPRTQTGETKL